MAFSSVFSFSCTPQTHSRILSVPSSHLPFRTTSLLQLQATQKLLHQPLRYRMISPINVANPKTCFGKVKAIQSGEHHMHGKVEVFSQDRLALSLAHDVYHLSQKFIQERGFFTVVLPGGSSIKHLRKLVEPPYVDSIEWSKWHFFWVEERVLAKDHSDTNYKRAYDRFLSKVPNLDLVNNVHSINGFELPAKESAELFEMKLRLLSAKGNVMASSNGFPKFDLMLLDMGTHEHPGHPDYLFSDYPEEDHKWVTFTTNFRKPPAARIAFTLGVIKSSSNIAMVVSGSSKSVAVHHVLEEEDTPIKLPIKMVSPNEGGEMKWYLDEGADTRHPSLM